MRVKREHLLYHGTLLYDFPLEMIGRCLAMPPREPDYRQARPHDAFVANLPLDAAMLRSALRTAWAAFEPCLRLAPGGHAATCRGKVLAARVERAVIDLECGNLFPLSI